MIMCRKRDSIQVVWLTVPARWRWEGLRDTAGALLASPVPEPVPALLVSRSRLPLSRACTNAELYGTTVGRVSAPQSSSSHDATCIHGNSLSFLGLIPSDRGMSCLGEPPPPSRLGRFFLDIGQRRGV